MAASFAIASKSKRYCSVPQCSTYKSENVSIHRFPTEKDLANKWKIALKIGKPISKCMTVCSRHFLEQDFSIATANAKLRRLKKGVIPSQNLPVTKWSENKLKNKIDRSNRKWLARDDELNTFGPAKQQSILTTELNLESTNCHNENDQNQSSFPQVLITDKKQINPFASSYGKYCDPLKKCRAELVDKATQTEVNYVSSGVQFVDSLDTEKKINCFTGVNSDAIETFEKCVQGVVAENNGKFDNILRLKIILVLIKLKLNLPFICLSVLFNISPKSCTKYFYDTLHLLVLATKTVVFWPTKEQIVANLPKCFKNFQNTRVVLDGTEIPVQKCKCLQCRIRTYSQYKSRHTLKFLVGITPSGLISYISPAYGGRASDKAIFLKSNLISKCNPHDALMVDKGFRIEKECEENYLKLIRPPFLKKQEQLTKEDAEKTADIARARVHVERTIQRIKQFKIMCDAISWHLIPIINDIMHFICALVNLSTPILVDDKFEKIDGSREDCIEDFVDESVLSSFEAQSNNVNEGCEDSDCFPEDCAEVYIDESLLSDLPYDPDDV